jgi:hypothetical protein
MNPYELRVNNLVHFTKEGVDSEIGHHHLGMLLSYPSSNDYDPIILTEEWLIKFGFVQSENNRWYEVKNFSVSTSGFVAVFIQRDWSNLDLKIEYIHQLQNLYFALTGEELIIKND